MSAPVIVPETSAKVGKPTVSRATADLSAKLQHAFDGLLEGETNLIFFLLSLNP